MRCRLLDTSEESISASHSDSNRLSAISNQIRLNGAESRRSEANLDMLGEQQWHVRSRLVSRVPIPRVIRDTEEDRNRCGMPR